jgi:putative redox protein
MTPPVGNSVHKQTRVVLETVEAPEARFVARFDSGARIALEGRSGPEAATPVEAVIAALGGCTGIDVISLLRKKRQEVTGYEVVVESERRSEHPRVFTRIEIVHRVRGRDLSPAAVAEAIRLSDTKYCSVHAMLGAGVPITSRFEILPG